MEGTERDTYVCLTQGAPGSPLMQGPWELHELLALGSIWAVFTDLPGKPGFEDLLGTPTGSSTPPEAWASPTDLALDRALALGCFVASWTHHTE